MLMQAQREAYFTSDIYSQPGIRRRSAKLQPLYAQERPSTHCTGNWVGLGVRRDSTEGSSHRYWIPRPSSPQQVATPTALTRPVEGKCITVRATYTTGESRPYMGVPGLYSRPKDHLPSACVVFPR